MHVEKISSNAYADLGTPHANTMQRKAMLVVRISDVISALEAWLKGHFRDADEAVVHACLLHLRCSSLTRLFSRARK